MKIVNHLEYYIGGLITSAIFIDDRKFNVSISLYENLPFEGVTTLSTLGLNHYPTGKYHHELIMVCNNNFNLSYIASYLTSFSEYLIDNNKSILKGEVFDFDFTISEETKMSSLFFTIPFYFDEDIQLLEYNNRTIIFPLLIPVYREESDFVKLHGYSVFESFLEVNEINNLSDLKRDNLIKRLNEYVTKNEM
jgi:hypothetical protein